MKEIIKAFNNIKSAQDLQREKLTLSDYRVIEQIIEIKRAQTYSFNVAKWFMNHGAYVEDLRNGLFLVNIY